MLERKLDQAGNNLSEAEVKDLLRKKGITTTKFQLPKREDLDSLIIEFPVAVKVCSSKIIHKTDVGGVFLDIGSREELKQSFDLIKERFPDSEVLVEPMEKKGPEVIIGLIDDKDFGLSIMFGMGGVMAELYKDVSFRKLPISKYDAMEMIEETKAIAFFKGFRGLKADEGAIIDLLLMISRLGLELEGRLSQLDLNPVILREKGYVVVDAKLVLK